MIKNYLISLARIGVCVSDLDSSSATQEGGSNCLEYVGILKVFLDYREEREAKLDSKFIVGKNIVYLSIQISYSTVHTSVPLFFFSLPTTHYIIVTTYLNIYYPIL